MAVIQTRCSGSRETAQYLHLVSDDETLIVGISSSGHPYLYTLAALGRRRRTLYGILQSANIPFITFVTDIDTRGTRHMGHSIIKFRLVIHITGLQIIFIEMLEKQLASSGSLTIRTSRSIIETHITRICCGNT